MSETIHAAMLATFKKLFEKLRKPAYRHAYVSEHVRRGIAHQIRAMREDPSRDWNQGELSRRLGKPQSVVSRIEDPDYGKLSVQTLLEVAQAFDVALVVRFVDFPTFIAATRKLTSESMRVPKFDPGALLSWFADTVVGDEHGRRDQLWKPSAEKPPIVRPVAGIQFLSNSPYEQAQLSVDYQAVRHGDSEPAQLNAPAESKMSGGKFWLSAKRDKSSPLEGYSN